VHITAQGPVSEMTYTVSSGTLNSTIPYLLLVDISVTVIHSDHTTAWAWTNFNKLSWCL